MDDQERRRLERAGMSENRLEGDEAGDHLNVDIQLSQIQEESFIQEHSVIFFLISSSYWKKNLSMLLPLMSSLQVGIRKLIFT